ncbi:hypothetical protein AV944_00575 [Sphingomonas sp. LK11]|uniref:hypothetical protein n=1 Tax=Sphingomonas sp. LK11 TaxID=1390395 RepID=UPI0009729933|nr:hypothetical protein [Sphingomonas sp. LK11]APX64593.1 hypothetical protein AV944_00575 [Sphingomonas sp. LK11]
MSDFAKLLSEMLAAELERMPILVTRADVLDHFAAQVEVMVAGLQRGHRLSSRVDQGELGQAMTEVWKARLPAIDLQIAAAKGAAKLMRDVAREDRILAARAAADQTNKEPTRG